MDATQRFGRILDTAGEAVRGYVEKVKQVRSLGSARDGGRAAKEMLRVTDALGDEYLCPVEHLKNASFVREEEKGSCYDYSMIASHDAFFKL